MVTGLVLPTKVRSPSNLYSPSATFLIEVLLNVIVGYFATSKKSALLKCSSLGSTRVFTELVCTVNWITASLKSAFDDCIVTSYAPKYPGTSAIPRCVTVNPNLEWYGSAVHVVCANAPTDTSRKVKNKVILFIVILFYVSNYCSFWNYKDTA